MKKYNVKFLKLRLCICLMIWFAGIVLCVSNSNLTTEYSYLSLYVPVDRIEFVQGDVLEQQVVFDNANLGCIGFAAVDRTKSCSGNIKVSVIDENNQCIWENTIKVNELELKTKKWFQLNQTVHAGEPYKLSISSDDLQGKLYFAVIDAADNIEDVEENLQLNGTESDTSLVLGITYPTRLSNLTKIIIIVCCIMASILIIGFEHIFKNKKNAVYTLGIMGIIFIPLVWFKHFFTGLGTQNVRLYICIMLVYYIAVGVNIWLYFSKKCKRVEIYFIVSYALIGMLYSAILPPFSAPDEGTHFAMSYRISNKMLGQPVNDANGMIYMRECDSYQYIKYPDNEYTIDTFEQLLDPLTESENMEPSNTAAFTSAYTLVYIPQAIGVTIGRLLHCNSIQLIYIGRLFNMLMFGGIMFLAIRIIPYGKWILYAISQIPIVMELTTSYSYDTFVLALAILFIAYVLRLQTQNGKVSAKQLIMLYMLGTVFAPMKAIYFFIVGLVIIISNDKISKTSWKAVTYKVACVASAVLFTLFVFKGGTILLTNYFQDIPQVQAEVVSEEPAEVSDGDELCLQDENIYVDDKDFYNTGNIEFIMSNPLDFIEDSVETVFISGDTYILSLFGNSLGSNEIKMPVIITFIIIMLYFFAAFRMYDGGKMELGIYKRALVAFIAIAIFGSVFFVFYTLTYPSRTIHWGIQGRYFLPILPLIIFGANVCGKEKKDSSSVLLFGSLGMQLLVILNVIMTIWTR